MPIYEYECTACQHQFDEVQKMNDPVITLCPMCSQETVIRLISAAGFQLKGTGWYVTDFKDNGKPKSGAASSADQKKTEKVTPTKVAETKEGDN